MSENILVVRGGAIGDFIVTLPVFSALKTAFPDSRIAVVGYRQLTQLAQAGRLVDETHPIESRAMAGFFAGRGELDQVLSDYFSQFDTIVSFLYDPDYLFRINLARVTRARVIQGPHRPITPSSVPASRQMLEPLLSLCDVDLDATPALNIPATKTLPRGKWLAVHPGSGSAEKNWPGEKWAELLTQLTEQTDWRFLVVAGEAEGWMAERLFALVPSDRIQFRRNLPLVDLAGLLGEVAAFVGHDSGITHLAASRHTPTLALWGTSCAEVWAPRGLQVRLLRKGAALAQTEPAEVADALAQLGADRAER